LIQYG